MTSNERTHYYIKSFFEKKGFEQTQRYGVCVCVCVCGGGGVVIQTLR